MTERIRIRFRGDVTRYPFQCTTRHGDVNGLIVNRDLNLTLCSFIPGPTEDLWTFAREADLETFQAYCEQVLAIPCAVQEAAT